MNFISVIAQNPEGDPWPVENIAQFGLHQIIFFMCICSSGVKMRDNLCGQRIAFFGVVVQRFL